MIKGYLNQVKFLLSQIIIADVSQGSRMPKSALRLLNRVRAALKLNSQSFNMAYPYPELIFRNH